jgi:hypothetical protein
MKQTAVEWLVEEMFKQGYLNDKPLTIKNIERFVNQAKEMEKQRIKDEREEAYSNGYANGQMDAFTN